MSAAVSWPNFSGARCRVFYESVFAVSVPCSISLFSLLSFGVAVRQVPCSNLAVISLVTGEMVDKYHLCLSSLQQLFRPSQLHLRKQILLSQNCRCFSISSYFWYRIVAIAFCSVHLFPPSLVCSPDILG